MKNQAPSGSKSSSMKPKSTKASSSSLNKTNKRSKKVVKNKKYPKPSMASPGSGKGQKWTTFVHNGVVFQPPYKPHGVKILYKGKPVDLTTEQEEVATMFARMLDTDYISKRKFRENFMSDWRKILGENHTIQNLDDCDFRPIYEWLQKEIKKRKQMTVEEVKVLKAEKEKLEEKYKYAIVDGVREMVGGFRVEAPGLFRGRGEHPKMGKVKRIRPSDITINIGKGVPIPECPIPGESWKEVRHDNTVASLAFWNDPITKELRDAFLAGSSSLKDQSGREKHEKARKLKDYTDVIKEQVTLATYLVKKLALRTGNE